MTSERWKKLDALFHEALELEVEERAAFLAKACGADQELRRQVERLIAAHQRESSFIDSPILAESAEQLVDDLDESPIGHRIGPYQVISQLGRGGMGEVYLAEDARLERKVALKVLPAAFTQNPDRVRRFEREAKAASALNHPNILTVHEIGMASTEGGSAHYIVSEFVEGETLREQMQRGPVSLTAALELAQQVASALAAAHAAGIVHRDIKPENVMVRPDGLVKVLDFGLAKLTEPPATTPEADSQAETMARLSTEPGVVMGTISYMSPEQARGLKVDHRTDIFSLGVVLYEMIAGRRPFEGATMSDVIVSLLTAETPPLKQDCAEATVELEQIVGKCLAKDREARYQSAKELIAELKTLRTGSQTAKAAATRRIEGAESRSALRRWPLIAAIAVVLIVGMAYFLSWQRTPAVQPDQIKSLAVLPLENLSGDSAQDYFADGMTETLISGLAKVGALRVSSRTSVMQYKETRKPLPDIARELNVDAVVEGSVQRFGERVKIATRLIHAPTERHLWTGTYERNLGDVLALQSEISRAIIQEIQIKLTPQEQMRLASARPVNPQAYDEYLRGRFYANRQNRADNETTIKTLERAVALDPTFAAAHAELALAYVWRFFLFTPEEKQWQEKAFVSVEKALSLDPDLAVAYLARGRLLWTPANHFPHEQAIQEYRRAAALNPSLDEVLNQLALVYNHIGAFDQALQELQKAVTINPSNTLVQFRIGQTLLFQGKYEQALTALRRIPREVNPRVGDHMAMALLHLGRRDDAAALVEEFLTEYPEETEGGLLTSVQAMLAALASEENKAELHIRSAIEKGKGFGHFHHTAYNIACAYSVMNKAEPAIIWLQAAADGGFPCYPLFETDPYLDHLRKDPRFIALMGKLKEQWEFYRTRL
jgi:eukaryotic-like serine/threonine-protein kinase